MTDSAPLPIDAALPALIGALRDETRAVLVAPPGAGKTTRVPLAILGAGLAAGRIVMLEPRRLAARAAAERMAATLGETAGQTVGYRIRGEARTSRTTRIEVVTEGILTRMIQADPALEGVGAVIFDEFHERSLHADLGLALTWEAKSALRPDLLLLVMSATLDAGPVAALLGGAPLVRSEGRSYPVETRWLPRPAPPGTAIETLTARAIGEAIAETEGSVLAFLPGEGEIRRTARLVAPSLPAGTDLHPLYGALDAAAQRRAVAPPAPGRRNVILATAIAETSLTLPGIRAVVDSGLSRRARFDPGSGMTRLVTGRVTRAEAEQRRGRAGRTGPGLCLRLWTRGEEGGLAAFPPPEIAAGDLAGLALELALWGATGADLAFLTPPPPAALAEARALLADLGALDRAGRITPHGRAMAGLPVHPRVAHMLLAAGSAAAPLAALIESRDPLPSLGTDLAARVEALGRGRDDAALRPVRAEAQRLARLVPAKPPLPAGAMAALAYPDRIGLRRPGEAPRYLLSGGKGAILPQDDPLGREALIVATDLDGDPREARIRQAAPVDLAFLRNAFCDRIEVAATCEWSDREGRVIARETERLGALVLAERPVGRPDAAALARAAFDGLRARGLPWSEAACALRDRAGFLRREGEDLPDLSDEALLADADWLLPDLTGRRTAADLAALDIAPALRRRLGHDTLHRIDRLAPSHVRTPLGREVPVDYSGEHPAVAVRLQEMFGVTAHPVAGPRRHPLRITLLSPGGRPIQITMDLPGFWRSSYAEVRRDMRGRYPKHPWPEDPTAAEPTLRAKPRA